METIILNDITIQIEKKAIKNIHLRVYPPEGRVHISAPQQMEIDSIRLFAIGKLEWIRKKQKELINFSRQSEREYVSGESHYFKGYRYMLQVIPQHIGPRIEIQGRKYINLYVRKDASTERRAEIMKDWYREELRKTLETLIPRWEKLLDVQLESWDIIQMKTKWGSCKPKSKKAMFNLELIKKPQHCIEYIVAHETAHLVERLHNDKFIAILDTYIPNWRAVKNELNEFMV